MAELSFEESRDSASPDPGLHGAEAPSTPFQSLVCRTLLEGEKYIVYWSLSVIAACIALTATPVPT